MSSIRTLSPAVQMERSARETIAPFVRSLSGWQNQAAVLRVEDRARRIVPGARSLRRDAIADLLAEVEQGRAAFVAQTSDIASAACVRNASSAFHRLVSDLGDELGRSAGDGYADAAPEGAQV